MTTHYAAICNQVFFYRKKFGCWIKFVQLAHNFTRTFELTHQEAESRIEDAMQNDYLRDVGGVICLTSKGYEIIGEKPVLE